jgi:hypothetical protein
VLCLFIVFGLNCETETDLFEALGQNTNSKELGGEKGKLIGNARAECVRSLGGANWQTQTLTSVHQRARVRIVGNRV